MDELTLVGVESSHIQSYIYASNRLKENVGASFLVAEATGQWAYDCIQLVTPTRNNLKNVATNRLGIDSERTIQQDTVDTEVLYSGGGNFLVLFENKSLALEFTRTLSRRVLRDAPGLNLTFMSASFHWKNDVLSNKVADLLTKLSEARSEQPLTRGVGGLGVTMMCSSSSLPAISFSKDLDNNWQVHSSEVVAKQDYASNANAYLRDQLELAWLDYKLEVGLTGEDFGLATEIDKLGRSEDENSYIGVVHADGNGLGQLIQNLKTHFGTSDDNREYITYMRGFSERVKQVNKHAQQAMFQQVVSSIRIREIDGKPIMSIPYPDPEDFNNKKSRLAIDLAYENEKWILPIRPLVSGGDDVTFVCDGRIALDLTMTFLQTFEEASKKHLGEDLKKVGFEKLTACAGISVVKTHYPFARAYDLADQLAGNAKQLVNDDARQNNGGVIRYSALDWHFTTGGIYGDLDAIRRREYPDIPVEIIQAEDNKPVEHDGHLIIRPIFAQRSAHSIRTWTTIRRLLMEDFQVKWAEHRSKAKGLMSALKQGITEVQVFNLRHLDANLPLPSIPGIDVQYGWSTIANHDTIELQRAGDKPPAYCVYFDALEILDLYLPLIDNQKDTAS